MKFTKGYWMNRYGVDATGIGQVRDVKTEGNKVYIYCVPYSGDYRSGGGPVIEMYISSPQPNIIRTEAYHFMGNNQKEVGFDINDTDITPEVENTKEYLKMYF